MSSPRRAAPPMTALLLLVLSVAACGGGAGQAGVAAVGMPTKPADWVDVFTWSQGVPEGARPVDPAAGTFRGPHFAFRFGALATRATTDETSGSLESGGPARAADGHEFLVLYRLHDDDSYAPPPEGTLEVQVEVEGIRKQLPRPLRPGSALITSVPTGKDALLVVFDGGEHKFSLRGAADRTAAVQSSGTQSTGAPSSGAPSSQGGGKQVRVTPTQYTGQGAYQGQRTSGPLGVIAEVDDRAELVPSVTGAGAAPAGRTWLRLPGVTLRTDDEQLKVDPVRSFSLQLSDGTTITPTAQASGLLFDVPDPFTGGKLVLAPEFPATSTAKWSTKPPSREIPVTAG